MTENIIEEAAILKLVARLAQAGDDRDCSAYRACFADLVCNGAPGEAVVMPADDYVHDAMNRLKWTEWTHHLLANPIIDIAPNGERAAAAIDVVVKMCRTDTWGVRFRGTLGGRYYLGFVLSDGGWRIERRHLLRRYVYCEQEDHPDLMPPSPQPQPKERTHA